MSAVRFFTTATLREHEEVPGEVVHWLPRAITVEYSQGRPVTGVWRSSTGQRRICWYGATPSAEILAAHDERYGREPFWIINRDARGQRVETIECDAEGQPLTKRVWEFDRAGMPTREEERSLEGTLHITRTYKCTSDGTVYAGTEQFTDGATVQRARPIPFPAVELAGEPFPCGGTISAAGPRLVAPIAQNDFQGRFLSVYRDDGTWKRGLATMATSKAWPEAAREVIGLAGEHVAPLVAMGQLEHRRREGYTFLGVVEAIPDGRSLDDVILEHPLSLDVALSIALEVSQVAQRAHAVGRQLG